MSKKSTAVTDSGTVHDEETGEVDETALALTSADGAITENATFDDLLDTGFTAVKTIKIGDPRTGGVPAYAGQLLSKGEPVNTTMPDGKGGLIEGLLPTWICHPAVLTRNAEGGIDIVPQTRITHVVITPHQLNADCGQLFKKMTDKDGKPIKVGLFATRWDGKDSIKGGARSLNMFSWRERLDPLPTATNDAE